MEERRRNHEYVTYEELRRVLGPIYERHRRADRAFAFYELMIPLGLEKLLPVLLRNEQVREALAEAAAGRWGRRTRAIVALGAVYGAITAVGSTIAILRTLGFIA